MQCTEYLRIKVIYLTAEGTDGQFRWSVAPDFIPAVHNKGKSMRVVPSL